MRGSRKWVEKGTDFEFSDLTAPRYAELAEVIATQSNVLKALAEPNFPPMAWTLNILHDDRAAERWYTTTG